MSEIPQNLVLQVRDQVSGALGSVKNSIRGLGAETEKTTGKFDFLKDSVKVAAGFMIRDFCNSMARSITESVKLGASVKALQSSFTTLVKTTGGTELSLEKLRAATKGTVSDINLLKSANAAMSLGLPTDQLDQLFASAMKLGRAMGIDTKMAVDSLATGIGRQSRLVLDNLGVVFKAEDAYAWWARQIGKSVNELDESEKRLGWQAYAIEEVTRKAEELGEIEDEAITKQEQWNAKIENAKTSLGGLLAPLSGFIGLLQPLMPMLGIMAAQLIPNMATALTTKLTPALTAAGISANMLAAGVGATVGGFTLGYSAIAMFGDALGPIGRSLLVVASAAIAAAAAVWALQSGWTLGAALAILAATTVAVGAMVANLQSYGNVLGLAEGGIVTKPTVAMIGEKGPEAVIPLSRGGITPQLREVTVNQYGWNISTEMDAEVAGEAAYRALMKKLRTK